MLNEEHVESPALMAQHSTETRRREPRYCKDLALRCRFGSMSGTLDSDTEEGPKSLRRASVTVGGCPGLCPTLAISENMQAPKYSIRLNCSPI